MDFTKMNGLGNDYIFFDCFEENVILTKNKIKFLCNRNFGIGGDGVVIMGKSNKANFKMEIINPDGTVAEMCGNALRCVAKFFQKKHSPVNNFFEVETGAGIKTVLINLDGSVTADMGKPITDMVSHAFSFRRKVINGFVVSIGNPHFVVEEDMIDSITDYGKKLSNNKFFPNRTNVEFVSFDSNKNAARIKVYERGVGETLACGTGATCVFEIGHRLKKLKENASLMLPGGVLTAKHSSNGNVLITGAAEFNYEGKVKL